MAIERTERESRILGELARSGSLHVAALSRELGVSEVTVRADLRTLEERGLLTRTHGGAEASGYRNVLERQFQHPDEKDRIAAAAAELVRDGDQIMIEAGTTTSRIVGHLSGRRGVQIVTNSTLVFANARLNPALAVILTGGTFHGHSESLVGTVAQRTIADFNVRLAFFGTDGFSVARGLTTGFAEGVAVIRAMQARAEECWLVADSSKYGHAGFATVMPISQLSGVITDEGMGEPARNELSESGVRVRYA